MIILPCPPQQQRLNTNIWCAASIWGQNVCIEAESALPVDQRVNASHAAYLSGTSVICQRGANSQVHEGLETCRNAAVLITTAISCWALRWFQIVPTISSTGQQRCGLELTPFLGTAATAGHMESGKRQDTRVPERHSDMGPTHIDEGEIRICLGTRHPWI